MMFDVMAIGELLIDFTQNGESEQGNLMFEANPGGAPGNVLAMLGMLGRKTAFIGKVGKDRFGELLREALEEQNINTDFLRTTKEAPTTLALVHKLPNGDRDFSFYRSPGADTLLEMDEIPEERIAESRILHFGTLSMTQQPARSATKKAVQIARENQVLVSFDPNLRMPLWKREEDARAAFDFGLANCDILKISDNEIVWFTGRDDIRKGIRQIREDYPNIRLVNASLGKDGSMAFCGNEEAFAPAFLRENTVDTTGAGDTFCACCLNSVLEGILERPDHDQLREMLTFANAAASLVTAHKGALRVMPKREEAEELIIQFSLNRE